MADVVLDYSEDTESIYKLGKLRFREVWCQYQYSRKWQNQTEAQLLTPVQVVFHISVSMGILK